jgi:predicted phosphate transport protein (TIGR00153 family)
MVRTMSGNHFRSGLLEALPSSPYKVLMEHFNRVCRAVRKLDKMVELYMKGEFTEASSVSVEINRLEHEADEIKRHLRANLPRMYLMPISREDLLHILGSNEKIVDSCQDVAQILEMRQTHIPRELHPILEKFMGHIIDAVDALRDIMNHLERLMESTFAKVETDVIMALGHRVHENEYKADTAGKGLSKAIYSLEGKESPMALFHMMRFADVLDSVADNAENAALRMVLVVSK